VDRLLKIKGFTPFILIIFLNAFIDLGHKILIQNTVFKIYDGQTQIILTAIVNGLILLPFIMLFSPAGFFSDHYRKPLIIKFTAALAVVLTLIITLSYYNGWFQLAFAMTFLLAVQSAFYSPAKYGYIKELVGKGELTVANAVVQALTIVAILAGVFLFSILFEQHLAGVNYSNEAELIQAIAPIGWVLVGCALLQFTAALLLPKSGLEQPELRFDFKQYTSGHYLRDNFGRLMANRVIWLSIIGLSLFWGIAQVVLAAFPAFAKETLSETNTIVIQGLLACNGLGIVLGSTLAGKASRGHIETGLIPVGALGIVTALLLIPHMASATLLGLLFIGLGMAGGLFIVPLNALIQFHAKDEQLGAILAGNNWVQNVVMLVFLSLTALFAIYGLSSVGLFYLLTLVGAVGASYTVYQLPQSLVRFLINRIIASRYNIQVLGFNNLPSQGGVLMLGNHISWLDWAIIQIACPRPVRFVMHREIYQRWYLKWFLDAFGVVPIASGYSKAALQQINELLKAGKVVCLFPEGSISRNGQLGEFRSGYERTVEGVDGVILPFYLRGLWGSRFSRSSEKLQEKRSSRMRRDVIVAFGKPLAMQTPAHELKQQVFDLSIDAWDKYTKTLEPIPLAWMRAAKQTGRSLSIADASAGTSLTGYKMLTAVLAFSRLIHKRSPEQNLGLLLPTSSAGMITNMATLLLGKTVVNLNYTANLPALLSAVDKAEIKSIYSSKRFLKKLQQRGINLDELLAKVEVHYLEDMKEEISTFSKVSFMTFSALLPAKLLYRLFGKRTDIEQPAAILFSSGSEGEPKGVMLSHRNIMANIKQISDVLDTRDDDKVMATLPLFHAFGLTVTGLMPLIEGVPAILHPDPTDTLVIAKAIAKNRTTLFFGTSTFLRLFNRNRRIHPLMLESLRLVVAGAERLNPEVRNAFKLKFNKEIYEGYGATETTPVASVNVPDRIALDDLSTQLGNKPGTVGMPLPGGSFRIVDPATLETSPVGEDGLILFGGTQIMLGYLNEPEKTAAAIIELDGRKWYKTGDKGHLDKDGFLIIIDRYSRFAKIGGEMISLSAIETAIRTLLTEEIEILATAIPNEKKGEQVVLLVAGNIKTEEIKTLIDQSELNPLMRPASLIAVDEIPKLGSGKSDFSRAKQMAVQTCAQ